MENNKDVIQISVIGPGNRTMKFNVKSSYQVLFIKKMLEFSTGIPMENQTLRFSNLEMDNYKILMDYNINKNSVLKFSGDRSSYSTAFTIFVKTDRSIPIHVNPSHTIEEIKFFLQCIDAIPIFTYDNADRFTFQSKNLIEKKTLYDYNICKESNIYYLINLLSCKDCKQFKKN